MDIHVDGNRSSGENWLRAQTASPHELPELSKEQKAVASRLGIKDEAYARSVLASDLERRDLEKKAGQAAQLILHYAQKRVSGIRIESVWLKTFDGKLRFDLESLGRHSLIIVSEDLIDAVLQSGSEAAEVHIARVVNEGLPDSWMAEKL